MSWNNIAYDQYGVAIPSFADARKKARRVVMDRCSFHIGQEVINKTTRQKGVVMISRVEHGYPVYHVKFTSSKDDFMATIGEDDLEAML